MPKTARRFIPVFAAAAMIALGIYINRRPIRLPYTCRRFTVPRIPNRDRFWLPIRRSSSVLAMISALVFLLATFPIPDVSDSAAAWRGPAMPLVSSRGGLRIAEIAAVLGATPPPVPVFSRPVGPPSPDPVLLAAARLALTPSPTPVPTASPLQAGTAGWLRDMGLFRVTAYSDSPFLNGTDGRGITRSGEKTRWGCVAVDPRIIPLGTQLVIENYEGTVFTALDTGGGIKGRWIDIWFPTDDQALQHGLRELAIAIVGGD